MDNNSRNIDQYNNDAKRSVLEREIWNKAIEAAAMVIDDCNREGPYQAITGARRIRELKK